MDVFYRTVMGAYLTYLAARYVPEEYLVCSCSHKNSHLRKSKSHREHWRLEGLEKFLLHIHWVLAFLNVISGILNYVGYAVAAPAPCNKKASLVNLRGAQCWREIKARNRVGEIMPLYFVQILLVLSRLYSLSETSSKRRRLAKSSVCIVTSSEET